MASMTSFLRQYLFPRPGAVEETEITYDRGDDRLAATVYRPVGRPGPLPGWVLLHGLTCAGRSHASLKRYARAMAAGGAVVLLPDVPEWRRLLIMPSATVPTIRAAVMALDARRDTLEGRIGVMGFSFGATQALVAGADARLRGHLAGVVSWGGYHDPQDVFRFALTGEHELDGVAYRTDPDPYSRWLITSNYLTRLRGYESYGETAQAIRKLVLYAGQRNIPSMQFYGAPMTAELRRTLPEAQREFFDAMTTRPSTSESLVQRAREFAEQLASVAVRLDPLVDPRSLLPAMAVSTVVAHGRDDRMIPFSESVRLGRGLPRAICRGCTITALFAHSGGTNPGLGPLGIAREGARFVAVLTRILKLV